MPTVKPLPQTLVVAGNYAQFVYWQRQDMTARNKARYVTVAGLLRGYPPGATLVFTGTYYRRTDLHDIMDYATSYGFTTTFEKST